MSCVVERTIGIARREKEILLDQLRDGKHENENLYKSVQTLSTKVDELEGTCKGLEMKLSQVTQEHEQKYQA